MSEPPPDQEIARLTAYLDQLRAAHGEFEHELRRRADAAERGDTPHRVDAEIRDLRRNLADNAEERQRVRRKLDQLRGVKDNA